MRRRGLRSNALRSSRAMAGLRSRALGPGARSWLTGVAGPRSRKRGPRIAERRSGAPEGAFLRFATEERDARKTSHRACFADRPPGASQAPAPAGAPLPSMGAGNCNSRRGPARGRPKNTGDEARPLVIPGRAPKARSRASSRNTREPGIHTPQHQKRMSAVPNTSTAASGFPGPLASASVPE